MLAPSVLEGVSEYTGRGGMVAWRLPLGLASKLALPYPDAEKPEDMHMTLCFFPDFAQVDTAKVEQIMREVMADGVLDGEIAGFGRFSASSTSDDKDVIYAALDVPGLEELRQELVSKLERAGQTISHTHGFTPHVTLLYLEPGAETPIDRVEHLPVTINHLVLSSPDSEPLRVGAKAKRSENPFDRQYQLDVAAYKLKVWDALEKMHKRVIREMHGQGIAVKAIGQKVVGVGTQDFWDEQRMDLEQAIGPGATRLMQSGALQAQSLGVMFDGNAVNQNILDYTSTYMDSWWKDLEASTRDGLRDAISQHISEGTTVQELSDSIAQYFGETRADRIAATEVTRLYAEGNRLAYAEAGVDGVEWQTVGDSLVDEDCADLEGVRWAVGEEDELPPLHVNCLVAGTQVSADVSAYFVRPYEGSLITLRTARGVELTVTSNHPILTPNGFMPAHLLQVGDEILRSSGIRREARIDVDAQHIEARIEQVPQLLGEGSHKRSVHLLRGHHFHGDMTEGNVDIVFANGFLKYGLVPELPQSVGDYQRRSRDIHALSVGSPALFSDRSRLKLGQRSFDSTHDIVSSLGIPTVLGRRSSAHHLMVGLSERPDTDALINQYEPNGRSAGTVRLSQIDDARAAKILCNDVFADTLTEVLTIEAHNISVYNLETPQGFYTANSIVTHNCRCWLAPVVCSGGKSYGEKVIPNPNLPPSPAGAIRDLGPARGFERATGTGQWVPWTPGQAEPDPNDEEAGCSPILNPVEEAPGAFDDEEEPLMGDSPDEGSEASTWFSEHGSEVAPNLTSSQQDALLEYKLGSGSYNDLLRKGASDAFETKAEIAQANKVIKALDTAIEQTELSEGITAHRAVGIDLEELLGKTPKVGDTFVDKGFISTTLDRRLLADMDIIGEGGDTVAIRIPRGARALAPEEYATVMKEYGAGLTEFGGGGREMELILPRGTKFKVIGRERDGTYILEVQGRTGRRRRG
jgi:2'-5' RNA ligase